MNTQAKQLRIAVLTGLLSTLIVMPVPVLAVRCSPCTPRSRQNPWSPCAAKNPCAANNHIDPKLVLRPNGSKS